MNLRRKWILTIGPALLVAVCYAIAAPSRTSRIAVAIDASLDEANEPVDSDEPLISQCLSAARSLEAKLDSDWAIVVNAPYVVAGDMSDRDLDTHYRQTIVPVDRALRGSYFVSAPRYPVTILLCSNDERFRECNLRLDQQERMQYSGLYVRRERRIVVNISSGDGTLAHELTHALAHADFPKMPEWFDEGLASLHEESEFSTDERHLIGRENWRQEVAVKALHGGELRLLEDVTSKRFGSFERAHVDYAHVRSMCLYLQELGLLESFYRTCRSNSPVDPTGLRSLCEVTESSHPRILDDAFRAWLFAKSVRHFD